MKNLFTLRHIEILFIFKNKELQQQKTSNSIFIKKDNEFKGDKVTVGNEGVIECGNKFVKRIFIHDRDSTKMN